MDNRNIELLNKYLFFLDNHINAVIDGKEEEFTKITKIAQELHVSHKHLTDIIKKETGHPPCYFYDLKIIEISKSFLSTTKISVAEIAKKLTYEPSNFNKFFKKWEGITPGLYRKKIEE